MKRFLIYNILTCLLVTSLFGGPNNFLVVDGGLITWKDIFEAGFKPKQLQRLEDSAVCYDQTFTLFNKKNKGSMNLVKGRTKFSFFPENQLKTIWHSSSHSINRNQVLEMVQGFEAVFSRHITREFNAPDEIYDPQKYPYGLPKYKIVALINGHKFILSFRHVSGFPESFTPHFVYYIDGALKLTKSNSTNSRDNPVQPPQGYEGYDISPISPQKVREVSEVNEQRSDLESQASTEKSRMMKTSENQQEESANSSNWRWLIVGAILLVLISFGLRRLKTFRQ